MKTLRGFAVAALIALALSAVVVAGVAGVYWLAIPEQTRTGLEGDH